MLSVIRIKMTVDFTGFLVQTDYQAKQTGFIQPYADSPMDHEQVGEECISVW